MPDELDQLSGLARPWMWLGVAALAIAVAALVIWSFAGTIPRTVNASGVIAEPGGLASVDSTVNGQVQNVLVNQSQYVGAGEPIATIESNGQQKTITAPFTGQVVDLPIIAGQVVTYGDPLFTIQRAPPETKNTSVYLFLPANQGAGLAPGMSVDVNVSTAPSAAFGVVRGKVKSVSETPLSTDTVAALVGNPDLARQLTKDGPPVLAQVSLTPDPKTRSGFQWSTPKGPPFPLEPGTEVTGKVTEQEQRPIDVIFGT
jgi:multidrug efflux pump subunit AcrA (membrane-fusion protein)